MRANGDVAVVRWPDDAATRTLLAADRVPRLLLVAEDADPPSSLDDLEDWLREPVEPSDLVRRSEQLRQRATSAAARPHVDQDGLLRFDGRWVVVSDAQLPLVQLLVERFGELVRNDELLAAYVAAGGTDNRSSIRTAMMRVRRRAAEVGLQLSAVRRRGFVLEEARSRR